ncbi:hypothetical protein ACOMHN_061205 [Nucella lapillus]
MRKSVIVHDLCPLHCEDDRYICVDPPAKRKNALWHCTSSIGWHNQDRTVPSLHHHVRQITEPVSHPEGRNKVTLVPGDGVGPDLMTSV